MTSIYVLKDPNTKNVMYVGKTVNIKVRYYTHCSVKKAKSQDLKEWITSLLNENQKPIIEVIEVCNNDISVERENYWINYYKTPYLLNRVINGKYELISCKRISLANKNLKTQKGKHFSNSHKDNLRDSQPHQKAILQFDLNGNFIKEWQNISFAAEKLNLHRRLIGKVCAGKRKQTGGFIFKFKTENI
jgi:hypothetical protein